MDDLEMHWRIRSLHSMEIADMQRALRHELLETLPYMIICVIWRWWSCMYDGKEILSSVKRILEVFLHAAWMEQEREGENGEPVRMWKVVKSFYQNCGWQGWDGEKVARVCWCAHSSTLENFFLSIFCFINIQYISLCSRNFLFFPREL